VVCFCFSIKYNRKTKTYHIVGTVPKYNRKTKTYHIVGTVPKYNRKTKTYHIVGTVLTILNVSGFNQLIRKIVVSEHSFQVWLQSADMSYRNR
jgi:hypothetical protein